MATKVGVSQRKLAKLAGMTHTAIQRAEASGRIQREPDGSYDPDKVLPALKANTNPAQQRRSPATDSFQQARTATEVLKARERRLRLQRLEGSLIPADILEEVVGAAFIRVRALLLQLPQKAAPTVAKLNDPSKVRAALEKLIHDALDELADTEVVAKIKRDSNAH